MNKSLKLFVFFLGILPVIAHSALIDRGLFDNGFGGMVRLIYDDDLNVTWLGDADFALASGFDADGVMTWDEAVAWADGLVVGGFGDWRLPTTLHPDPACSNPSLGGVGFNCTGGEMGHLFYIEGINRLNPGPFVSTPREPGDPVVRENVYWSATEFDLCSGPCAWIFLFQDGFKDAQLKFRTGSAWAVRSGDVLERPLTIDIKPGSDSNSINPASRGKIPVAILTTDTFDATQVDPLSVAFGPDGASESHGRSHVKDIDDDGDADLILHFNTQETGIQCGDTEATLTGETFGGEPITGTDSITTVHCL